MRTYATAFPATAFALENREKATGLDARRLISNPYPGLGRGQLLAWPVMMRWLRAAFSVAPVGLPERSVEKSLRAVL